MILKYSLNEPSHSEIINNRVLAGTHTHIYTHAQTYSEMKPDVSFDLMPRCFGNMKYQNETVTVHTAFMWDSCQL